ncbi:Pan2 [Kluyveromyces lactis]|nr:Pan2 [Kluyveromyces lactis]
MNNWQLSYQSPEDLTYHLKKPYLQYDKKEKQVTKVVFDTEANLIWAGDSYGRVSSYDPTYSLYTRHTAHIGSMPVVDLLSNKNGILSLSSDSLHFSNRRGVTQMNITSADIAQLSDMKTMCYYTNNQNQVLCAGGNTASGIISVDLIKGSLASSTYFTSKVKHMSSNNKLVAIGKQAGSIDLFDPVSNRVVHSLSGHSASITSMDFKDNTLVTAGKSKTFGYLQSDQFINVYDVRIMKQLPPISFSKTPNFVGNHTSSKFPIGADYLQLHPVLPTVVAVASSSGSFDFIDLVNPSLRTPYIHPCKSISQFTLSPSGDYLAFLEEESMINMWNRSNSMSGFTNSAAVLEYQDYPEDSFIPYRVEVDQESYPLSSIGLPYYSETLLSAWPHTVFKTEGIISKKVEGSSSSETNNNSTKSVNRSLSHLSSSKYSLQPYNKFKYGPRNVVGPYKSLRERRKKMVSTTEDNQKREELLEYKPSNNIDIPPAYSKLQMIYGKFGVMDFDFGGFNTTQYSGLETDIDCVYVNEIIHLYRFVPEVYNFVVNCLEDEHIQEKSVLTELGFLFDMMTRANGKICRASNFVDVLESILTANELGLFTDEISTISGHAGKPSLDEGNLSSHINNLNLSVDADAEEIMRRSYGKYMTVAQKFNIFLLDRLISEEVERKLHSTDTVVLEELFGLNVDTEIHTLSTCGNFVRQPHLVSSLVVLSPASNNVKYSNKKLSNQTILPYIESSMCRFKQLTARCSKCEKLQNQEYESVVRNLPPLLSLNICLSPEEWTTAKTVNGWLSNHFFATISKDRPILKLQATDLKTSNAIFKYELMSYVARITDDFGEEHLVTYAKILDQKIQQYKWYMFNDFLVQEIDEDEALNISYWWKTPEIVVYSDAEEIRKPFVSVSKLKVDTDILYRDYFSEGIRKDVIRQYRLLTKDEAPGPGTLVALDAEFVSLTEPYLEINCKGMKTLLKPAKKSLARVSLLRGEGELEGVPFIDDYIINECHIEDYLTQFSGIEPGDLDPKLSKKSLVKRQVFYRKMWLLLQLGCVFVGHGLTNDFRQINIYVPESQIRDTSLYYLKGKRYLSLRYLAFAVLRKQVQTGNHDSIEDAHTALLLYRKYLELKEKGVFEMYLENIYDEGRKFGFKVPDTI